MIRGKIDIFIREISLASAQMLLTTSIRLAICGPVMADDRSRNDDECFGERSPEIARKKHGVMAHSRLRRPGD
jgi:hypothetical protein